MEAIEYPRLFAVVCVVTGTVEYCNTKYTSVQSMFSMIPNSIRDNFALVRYDANPNYTNNNKGE